MVEQDRVVVGHLACLPLLAENDSSKNRSGIEAIFQVKWACFA